MLRHLALPAALLTIAAAPATDPFTPGREVVTDLNKIVTANGVQETFVATLGGARQVVNVRGADRRNPILLFIHGGPASVEMPLAWSFQRPWEDYFTVVHWDQRGAGRSFLLNDQAALAPTLKPARYRDDTIELIEQLRQRYGKRKVVLMGLSWGSMVGLMVAQKRPDLLYAYVGVGQGIDFRENEVEGYRWTLEEARRRGDTVAVKELEAIAPYPGPGAFDLQKLDVERKWNVPLRRLAVGPPGHAILFSPGPAVARIHAGRPAGMGCRQRLYDEELVAAAGRPVVQGRDAARRAGRVAAWTA